MARSGLRSRLLWLVFAAIAHSTLAQPADPELSSTKTEDDLEDVEKRYTPELRAELNSCQQDALLLFTEYSARVGAGLKSVLQQLAVNSQESTKIAQDNLDRSPEHCREELHKQLKNIEHEAHKAASFSAENHSKYILGHMIVFNMHLNKSEDYVKKCERVRSGCGIKCETTRKLIRWRRMASNELHRVQDDILHSRLSYEDLIVHYNKRMARIKKQAAIKSQKAVDAFMACS